VHEQIHQHQPQLVILDLHLEMPAAGLQILQQLRADAQTTHLPVLLCTVDDTLLQHYRERLVALRCATLRKPFTLTALLESVVTLIGHAGDGSG
jgi:CheY-like chemotaxis protein